MRTKTRAQQVARRKKIIKWICDYSLTIPCFMFYAMIFAALFIDWLDSDFILPAVLLGIGVVINLIFNRKEFLDDVLIMFRNDEDDDYYDDEDDEDDYNH